MAVGVRQDSCKMETYPPGMFIPSRILKVAIGLFDLYIKTGREKSMKKTALIFKQN